MQFLRVQYCPSEFQEDVTSYNLSNYTETDNISENQKEDFKSNLQDAIYILRPIYEQKYELMEIEKEEEARIEKLISQQHIDKSQIASQIDIDDYFTKIVGKLEENQLLDNKLRKQYMDLFGKDIILRKQCSTVQMIINLLQSSFKLFMNTNIDNIGLLKIFIEDTIDAYISGSQFPQQQTWPDYKIMSLAVIIKIMKIQSKNGQLVYESIVAFLYKSLSCVFSNGQYYIPKYKDYFEYYFWEEDKNLLKIEPLNDNDKSQIRLVSIIRKLSFLLWSLVWIDPNQILTLNPTTNQFRQDEKIPAYTDLIRDRKIFFLLLSKFLDCKTFAFVPVLNSLYDVVQDKQILLPIFKKFESRLQDNAHLNSLLDQLGQFKDEAKKEFFQYPQVHDEGLVQIVNGKYQVIKGEPTQTEIDFYEKLFSIDQRPSFYSE